MVNWRKAIVLWLQGKVEVLEFHSIAVHSPSCTLNLPAVIRLKQYIRPYLSLSVRLSRQNVFLRDEYICQYCQKRMSEKRLTIDHVIPWSKRRSSRVDECCDGLFRLQQQEGRQ